LVEQRIKATPEEILERYREVLEAAALVLLDQTAAAEMVEMVALVLLRQ
jgi:hypothetical protein